MAPQAAALPHRVLVTALWLVSVAGPGQGPSPVSALAAAVLGVEPGSEASYEGSTFRCLNGVGEPLPAAAINDEACDCADGSDEPGTGACAGQDKTLFFCQNKGSVPRRIYASRVGDGVCDCCDGSDEESLAKRKPGTKCNDVCSVEGAQDKVRIQEKVEMLRRALQKQEDIRKEGMSAREKLSADLDTLDAGLPALESSVEVAKVAADAQREAEAAIKAQEEAAATAKKEAEDAAKVAKFPNCQWRQTGGCKPDGEREATNDKPCTDTVPSGTSGFCDCDGDGALGTAETGFTCEVSGGTRKCLEECLKSTSEDKEEEKPEATAEKEETEAIAEEEETEAAGDDEKPQVSEYSKWMDGASETKGAAGEDDKPQVSEYSKWMDGAADTDGAAGGEETAEEVPVPETVDEAAEGIEAAPKEQTAVEKETAAQSELTDHKDKIQQAKDSLDSLSVDMLGFANLMDKKFSKFIGEWTYDINFFGRADQGSTSLGSWSKWTGPRSGEFTDGHMCWGGPARKLLVNFVCGEKEEILDCFEPSRCVYEATIEHPGACSKEELDTLAQGKQVHDPRDEL